MWTLLKLDTFVLTVMRLGKKKEKEKENEPKSQTVDGVTRLICSAKTHNIPLRGKLFNLKNLNALSLNTWHHMVSHY